MNFFLMLVLKKLKINVKFIVKHLNVKEKLLMNSFNFFQFHEHSLRSRSSQMFYKIGALNPLMTNVTHRIETSQL